MRYCWRNENGISRINNCNSLDGHWSIWRHIHEKTIVLFKYLDVALFAALAGPLSTLVFILSIVKIKEIRTNKIASGEAND